MKKALVYGLVAAFLCCGAYGIAMAEADKGPENIIINPDSTKPATFPHVAHQAKNGCADCHHGKTADGKQVPYVDGQPIGKCASCHNESMGENKLAKIKEAGHGNCLTCHKAQADKPDLKKCTTCHVKK